MMLLLLPLIVIPKLVHPIKFNKLVKHQYQSLKDIERDMTIQKLEKFKNILQ